MGASVVRIGDIGVGVCPAHTSPQGYTCTLITGAPNVLAESSSVTFIGSIAVSTCGHPVIVISGSSTVITTSSGTARIGDMGTNPGPCVFQTGATTVLAG